MRKLIKSPVVHFALVGLALFVGDRWLFASGPSGRAPNTHIAVSQSQFAALVSQHEATTGLPATDEVRAELIARFAEEEMLYRESHRWGLKVSVMDSNDAVIRNMLVQNMRLLLSRQGEQDPTDEELEAYYQRERPRFARPARLTGWHVFFSKDLRQSSAMAAARAAKATLDAEPTKPEEAAELGDVFPSGARFKGQLARQLASRFGEGFAKAAEDLAEGQWSDPVETPFGLHLVFVEERTEPQAPPLAEIRARVVAAYKSSQSETRLAAAMEELRTRYQVVGE